MPYVLGGAEPSAGAIILELSSPRSSAEQVAVATQFDVEEERAATERERRLARRRRIIERVQGEGLVLVFGIVFVIMWASSPYFLTEANLLTVASVVATRRCDRWLHCARPPYIRHGRQLRRGHALRDPGRPFAGWPVRRNGPERRFGGDHCHL